MATVHITDAAGLQAMNDSLADDYILDNNINLSGVTWTPVGVSPTFTGTFDGQNFTISNLTDASLFGILDGATVQNLIMTGVSIDVATEIGALCQEAYSNNANNPNVIDCEITATIVTTAAGAGIIAGYFDCNDGGKISGCYTHGSVTGDWKVGGLVGNLSNYSTGTVEKCYSDAQVISTSTSTGDVGSAGGLFGQDSSDVSIIQDCYFAGTVTGYSGVGGLIGLNWASDMTIKNCYSAGDVTGYNLVGGFIGDCEPSAGSILNCYSVGTIAGTTDVGGFLGYISTDFDIVNCAWDVANSTLAIGHPATALLVTGGQGTDETDHLLFYSKTHTVYDQGNANAWDFAAPIWYEWSNTYPLFISQVTELPIKLYERDDGNLMLTIESTVTKPATDNVMDLGASALQFKDLYVNGIAYTDEIQLETTQKIQLRDSAINIASLDDGHLDLVADTSIDLNSAITFIGTTDKLEFRDTGLYLFSQADGYLNIVSDTGTRLGDATPTNYTQINAGGDITQVGTARIDWSKKTAASVTITVGDTDATSVVANLQTENDGNIFHLDETTGTPGLDFVVDFTGITAFNWVQIRATYSGSATHGISISLWDWTGTPAWKHKTCISDQVYDATAGQETICNESFFVPTDTNYIGTGVTDGGKVRVRFVHPMGGTANHDIYVDCVALYQ